MSHLLDENSAGVMLDEQSNRIDLDPVTYVNPTPAYESGRAWYRASKVTADGLSGIDNSLAYYTEAEALTKIAEFKQE